MRVGLLRAVGAATAAYGIAVALRPEVLAVPSGLTEPDGSVTEHTKVSLRPVGWRDAASGLAMLLAPAGPALRTATLLRAAADLGDAVVCTRLPGRVRQVAAITTSVGWGALSVAGLLGRPAEGGVGRRCPEGPGRPRRRGH